MPRYAPGEEREMAESVKNPRILIVTPEVTYLPERMGSFSNYLTAKAGGLADVSAALIKALFDQGADVHVALPDYRAIFNDHLAPFLNKERQTIRSVMPDDKIHLAQDRAFYYMNKVYSDYGGKNTGVGLAFQREVINNIIPRVKPDLIHCNDWMTGLIPAMSRRMGIPCLFTLHNIHTVKCTLAHIEDKGIDAAYFWDNLYYDRMAYEYESARSVNPVDFLVSGVFAAHFVNTVSPTFLDEIIEGRHAFVTPPLMRELAGKKAAQCAVGILNAPDPAFNPAADKKLPRCYTPENHGDGKRENKLALQKALGLLQNKNAPVFYWPSRLDPVQKGCHLLTGILYDVISRYWDQQLQFVFIADGEYQPHFRNIVTFHQLHDRVAICNFNEHLEHLAYGAADFVLMPSLFEPCGLPQMIGPIYGTLPVAHDTGGIHDTVTPIDTPGNTGNGFLFEAFDTQGLSWAIDQALDFYQLPARIKNGQIKRIMQQSAALFNHSVTAGQYIDLYEKMLKRPLIV